MEYGIITPYTSYLVTEQQEEFVRLDEQILAGEGGVAMYRLHSRQKDREEEAKVDDESITHRTIHDQYGFAMHG